MKVVATKDGVYGGERKRKGDEFEIKPVTGLRRERDTDGNYDGSAHEVTFTEDQQFSKRWMKRVKEEKQSSASVTVPDMSGIEPLKPRRGRPPKDETE